MRADALRCCCCEARIVVVADLSTVRNHPDTLRSPAMSVCQFLIRSRARGRVVYFRPRSVLMIFDTRDGCDDEKSRLAYSDVWT